MRRDGIVDPQPTTEKNHASRVDVECSTCGWTGKTEVEFYECGVYRRTEFDCPRCDSFNIDEYSEI